MNRGKATIAFAFGAALLLGVLTGGPAVAADGDLDNRVPELSELFFVAQPQQLTVRATAATAPVVRDSYGVTTAMRDVTVAGISYQYLAAETGKVVWPLPDGTTRSSGFGPRQVAGCSFCSTNHRGVDLNPAVGTIIRSAADGIVSKVNESKAGLGTHVILTHVIDGVNVDTVYGHMLAGSPVVKVGDPVFSGEPIGVVGSTGASTGLHLHFEVRVGGVSVDPVLWMGVHVR